LLTLSLVVPAVRARAQSCPALPGDAFAFLGVDARCPVPPIVRWPVPSVVFDCGFLADAATTADCGDDPAACVEICREAAQTWNTDLPGRFTFKGADASTPVGFCDEQDGRVSVGGGDTLCDGRTAFGPRVLAVTLRITVASGEHKGQMIDSNVVVNRAVHFDPGLFRATIGHELGHALGLDHPDQCGHDGNVLMRSVITRQSDDPCFVSAPTADDLTGAETIYPVTGPTTKCGDADRSGEVGVADGVQVLRAAAGLSSVCAPDVCDVDHDGTVAVSDAVNVLRAAAGLSSISACQ
jgi:hypothetical protein